MKGTKATKEDLRAQLNSFVSFVFLCVYNTFAN